ncbi:MAG: hypothetical protein CSA70_08755 [Rhodobacterales bacterium]|nr:MAG: hypothetical protein CSA70_08755 [Rhodobacterales bacterium]
MIQSLHIFTRAIFIRAFALVLISFPAQAAERLGAEEFDTLTRSKTFYFGRAGKLYGGEQYLEGREVLWSFLDGNCKRGRWYEEGGMICFVYEDRPEPQCWSFEARAGGLVARYENNPEASELYEVEQNPKPLYCKGPAVGG